MARFVKPETVRINLTGGDWLLVKRQLTAGEQRRVFARTTKPVRAGLPIEIDLEKAGLSQLVEYLVDWSFTDHEGRPVVIRDMPSEFVMDILNSLDADTFAEVTQAIAKHEQSIEEEKKNLTTTIES